MAREPLHQPVHEAPRRAPNFDTMSDDELMAYVASTEAGNVYEVPPGLEPDGYSYAWKRAEVAGKPDYANLAMMEQKGWEAVPQERHDGRWMPHGTKGPIIVNGLQLMQVPTRFLRAKEAYRDREAKAPTDSLKDRLSDSRTGAPRTVERLTRTPNQGPIEFSIE